MTDDRTGDEEQSGSTDFLLEEEESGDLETAIREALEAVERGGRDTAGAGDAEVVEPQEVQPREGGDEGGAEARIAELEDRLVRALADFDNFRKRSERERADGRKYEGFALLREFLSIVDNLERALESEGPVEDLKTGVELIRKQMHEVLARHGVRRIDTSGEVFDPRLHEAISRHPDAETREPRVSEELQAGYTMHERLLRPARVRVAMPPDDDDPGAFN